MPDLKSRKYAVLSGAVLGALSVNRASAQVSGPYGTTPYENGAVGGYLSSTSAVTAGGPNSVAIGGIEVGNSSYVFTSSGQASGGTQSSSKSATGYILTPGGTINLDPAAGGTGPTSTTSPDSATSINTLGTLIAGLSNSYSYTNASNTLVTGSAIAGVWNTAGTYIPLPVAQSDAAGDGPLNSGTLINNGGTVVGRGTVYASSNSGTSLGSGSFVWTNSGTAASPVYTSYSELLAPQNSTGSIATGSRTESVFGISDSGLAVGSGSLYNGTVSAGVTAVTWDTTSTPTVTANVVQTTIAAVPLVSPALPSGSGTTPFGTGTFTYSSGSGTGTGTVAAVTTTSQAAFVNRSNVIAGTATIYNSSTANASTGRYTAIGSEAIVWNGPGSTGTFLPLSASYVTGNAVGINGGGDVLGGMQATGVQTAVLWKYGASSPTVLAAPTGTNPLTNAAYTSYTFAKGVNDEDYSVGYLGSSANDGAGTNALLWNPNGSATDLNTLITEVNPGTAASPGTTAGWVSLFAADAISDDGWISGVGVYYDPGASYYATPAITNDVPGEYYRPFLLQDAAAVPEPASLAVIAVAASALISRRRRNPSAGKV